MGIARGATGGPRGRFASLIGGGLAILVAVAGVPGSQAQAQALVVRSMPTVHEVVTGPDLEIQVYYNAWVDARRSRLSLKQPDGTLMPLTVEQVPKEPGSLMSRVTGLASGSYVLHWQTLSVDGRLTRGDIDFTVGRKD